MAKVAIEFDTKTKAMSATMDGEQIPNVCGIFMSCRYDDESKMRCEIMQRMEDEENDTHTYTQICASEDGVTREKADSVLEDIAAYFAHKGEPHGGSA